MLADPEQTIYLADMSGDGLSDLVRVRNGEICYWPNIGFGRFGAKVTMDRCPWLDQPGHFDQRRVRLADVDGSGAADLIYLHPDGTRLYLNQSGNGFSEPHTLPQGFPRLDSLAQVMVADLLGRGTACLVWSSPLPGDSRTAAALRRPDGGGQALPAHRDRQQPGRGNQDQLRAVHPVLPRRRRRRAALGDPAAVSRAGGRAGARPSTGSTATGSPPATPTTTATSTASSASSAASAWSSSGTPRNSRCWRPPRGRGEFSEPGPGHGPAAGTDPHLAAHRRVPRRGPGHPAVRARVLPPAGRR